MIFGFLFASNPIRPCQNMGYGDFCNQQDTNILLVNHQIHAEALDILFKEGTFVTEISEWRVAFLSSLTNTQNLEVVKAPKCAQKIRNVIIKIYMDIETNGPGAPKRANHIDQITQIHENMRSVCHALSMNGELRTLEVSCWHKRGRVYILLNA